MSTETPRTDAIKLTERGAAGLCQDYATLAFTLERELAAAQQEIERLREALRGIEKALRTDSRDKSIIGDEVEYHLDGQTMYLAINAARRALGEEG